MTEVNAMRRIYSAPMLVLLIAATQVAIADSPITSTPFADAYMDYAIVEEASESGVMTEAIAHYLADSENPIDVRAAVINALSWDIDGKSNAELFCQIQYRRDEPPKLKDLRGDEAMVIGYLMVMDNYFEPEKALPFVKRGRKELPESFTAAMVAALVEAQDFGVTEEVWSVVEDVVYDPDLNGDMRLGAMRIITDYTDLYGPDQE